VSSMQPYKNDGRVDISIVAPQNQTQHSSLLGLFEVGKLGKGSKDLDSLFCNKVDQVMNYLESLSHEDVQTTISTTKTVRKKAGSGMSKTGAHPVSPLQKYKSFGISQC